MLENLVETGYEQKSFVTIPDGETISRELIYDLFVSKKLTDKEIAQRLNTTYDKIFYLRHIKYNISRNRIKNTYRQIKETELNTAQKDIIIGSMFGDGCVGKNRQGNCFYLCEQVNKEYVKYKKGIIGSLAIMDIKYRQPQGFCKKGSWRFSTITHPYFNQLRELFYETINGKNRKIVPESLLKNLTEKMLAIWFFDDGTYAVSRHKNHYHKEYYLYTDAFNYNEQLLIQKYLYSIFGLQSNIYSLIKKPQNKQYFFIRFAKATIDILKNILRSNMADGMSYKLGTSETTSKPTNLVDDIVRTA